MTLGEFSDAVYTAGEDTTSIFVFDSENDCDKFARGDRDVDILLTLCSALKAGAYLKERYSNAPVAAIYAIAKNRLAVVIDTEAKA